jgi:hypothetical protein
MLNEGVAVVSRHMLQVGIARGLPDQIALTISDEQQPLGQVVLNAEGVERLIMHLAGLRARLNPEVPRFLPAQAPAGGSPDPMSMVYDRADLSGKVLAIRHDGLGWLSFIYGAATASRLAGRLTARLPGQRLEAPSDRPS